MEKLEKKRVTKDDLPLNSRILFSSILIGSALYLLYDFVETDLEKSLIASISWFLGICTLLYLIYKFFFKKTKVQ